MIFQSDNAIAKWKILERECKQTGFPIENCYWVCIE